MLKYIILTTVENVRNLCLILKKHLNLDYLNPSKQVTNCLTEFNPLILDPLNMTCLSVAAYFSRS